MLHISRLLGSWFNMHNSKLFIHATKRAMSSILSRKIEVNDAMLHFDITGTGKHTLLLLPGALGCSQTDFKLQMEHFNKDLFTLLAWDPRGYGKSIPPTRDWPEQFFRRDADDAMKLMENLGVKKYSLLGWSDGGITATIMAAGCPDRVQSLVIWGANAFVTQQDTELYERIRNIDHWSDAMRKPFLDVYGNEYFRTQFSSWVDAISAYFKKFNGDICCNDARAVCCPTLILHGAKDPLVPRFHPEFLLQNIKNSRLEEFPNGKHNIHQRFYQEFNSIVEKFLQSNTQFN